MNTYHFVLIVLIHYRSPISHCFHPCLPCLLNRTHIVPCPAASSCKINTFTLLSIHRNTRCLSSFHLAVL